MTGHTSDETLGQPQGERSRDSRTIIPERDTGVVQDSPGAQGTGDASQGRLDEQGNFKNTDESLLDDVDEE
ncbi:hypothetical protein [Deinococcus ficus]|uniref:hypothetical protein n=1 Tax=Deinococcus ficus TaxID=317577 RepID=UPI0017495571|nr:hypothetical protein [Deinococcus ficus]GHF72701.1 hypothetical protein GCM10017782_07860 [Deinococcus ficus]